LSVTFIFDPRIYQNDYKYKIQQYHARKKYHPRELEFKLKDNIDKDLYLYVNIANDGQDNALDDFIL
jgi:hypothetical protein